MGFVIKTQITPLLIIVVQFVQEIGSRMSEKVGSSFLLAAKLRNQKYFNQNLQKKSDFLFDAKNL